MNDENGDNGTWENVDDDLPEMPDGVDFEDTTTNDDADPAEESEAADGTLSAASDGFNNVLDGDRVQSAAEAGGKAVTETAAAGAYATKLGSALAGTMLKTAKLIPKQSRLFRKLAVGGLKGYYKRSGADALGIEARPNGELGLVPISYLTSEVTDEGQRPGWQVHGRDRTYDAASMGDSVHYLKDTPVVPLHSDSTVESTWMAPRIAEAVELEQYAPIFEGAEFNPVFDVQPHPAAQHDTADGDDGALADGGNIEITRDDFRGFDVGDPGRYAGDAVVDLSSDHDHDGMRISFAKAQDILDERTTSERMDMQEQRGRIMSQLQGGKEAYAMKMLLIAAAAIVLSIMGVTVLPEMIGGGGGGGSLNPLLALPVGV